MKIYRPSQYTCSDRGCRCPACVNIFQGVWSPYSLGRLMKRAGFSPGALTRQVVRTTQKVLV